MDQVSRRYFKKIHKINLNEPNFLITLMKIKAVILDTTCILFLQRTNNRMSIILGWAHVTFMFVEISFENLNSIERQEK